jgi:Protein of unknown function (DUF3043)
VALFRRPGNPTSDPEPVQPVVQSPEPAVRKKAGKTPSRREAEAARRQRVNRTLTKKEARAESARQARVQRTRSMNARDNTPEKALLRDYIDSRRSVGEFLLPSLVVILAGSFLGARYPGVTAYATFVMYLFIAYVLFDSLVLMWRGYKRILDERLPGTSTRGLRMYGMNRCIQIRRFRMPPPRIKRGEAY